MISSNLKYVCGQYFLSYSGRCSFGSWNAIWVIEHKNKNCALPLKLKNLYEMQKSLQAAFNKISTTGGTIHFWDQPAPQWCLKCSYGWG